MIPIDSEELVWTCEVSGLLPWTTRKLGRTLWEGLSLIGGLGWNRDCNVVESQQRRYKEQNRGKMVDLLIGTKGSIDNPPDCSPRLVISLGIRKFSS